MARPRKDPTQLQPKGVHILCDPAIARSLDIEASRLGRSVKSCAEEAIRHWLDPLPDLAVAPEHAEHVQHLLRILMSGNQGLIEAITKPLDALQPMLPPNREHGAGEGI